MLSSLCASEGDCKGGDPGTSWSMYNSGGYNIEAILINLCPNVSTCLDFMNKDIGLILTQAPLMRTCNQGISNQHMLIYYTRSLININMV